MKKKIDHVIVGKNTIQDNGGYDKLVFDEGINREDVLVQLNRNRDLIIAVKEEGKTFDELSDKVIMIDWMKPKHRVERIEFGDGSTLKFQDVFAQFEASDGVENIIPANNTYHDSDKKVA